jgi:hypothetical protein
MVLNRMADLVGSNCDSGQGLPAEVIGRQADRFGLGIIMVALLSRRHLDVRQVEPIEKVSRQLPPASRIVRAGLTVLGKYPSGPELRTENDNSDKDYQQGYQHFSLTLSLAGDGSCHNHGHRQW